MYAFKDYDESFSPGRYPAQEIVMLHEWRKIVDVYECMVYPELLKGIFVFLSISD